MDKVRILIIDDSAVMRKFLSDIMEESGWIEVVGTAMDPYIAAGKIPKLQPDVVTLDIEMPRMDGLTFLSKLMIASPMPVLMVSTLTEKGARETLKALELGAVDFVTKPNLQEEDSRKEFAEDLLEKIRAASRSRVSNKPVRTKLEVEKKFSADVILKKKKVDPREKGVRSEKIIAIGASTGGTEVIGQILTSLNEDLPGIVIAQHMPEKFTEAFANRVNNSSSLLVKEAVSGERLFRGMAVIAPGGKHMLVKADGNSYRVEINDGPPVNRHKPSVDVLFRSVSQVAGKYSLGIICTGMGSDGAAGITEMRESGARTVGQNEQSSVVYGMPREAKLMGGIDLETDVQGIINEINTFNR